jgi:hypothetical protein
MENFNISFKISLNVTSEIVVMLLYNGGTIQYFKHMRVVIHTHEEVQGQPEMSA